MAALNSVKVIGRVLKTSALRCPQRKKSHGDKSGDLAGQGTSPRKETTRPGNISCNTVSDNLAVCAVAPSCWNQILESICSSLESFSKFCLLALPKAWKAFFGHFFLFYDVIRIRVTSAGKFSQYKNSSGCSF